MGIFRFRIDPPALARAAAGVSGHLDEIETARQQVARAGEAASAFGSAELAAAYTAAIWQWEEELRIYRESLLALAENLSDAARDYAETDKAVI